MASTLKPLASGELPTTEAALYTVPADTTGVVTTVTLHNTTTGAVTCTLKTSIGGDVRVIADIDLAAGYTYENTEKLMLAAGDAVRGMASATGVDYTLHGLEKT